MLLQEPQKPSDASERRYLQCHANKRPLLGSIDAAVLRLHYVNNRLQYFSRCFPAAERWRTLISLHSWGSRWLADLSVRQSGEKCSLTLPPPAALGDFWVDYSRRWRQNNTENYRKENPHHKKKKKKKELHTVRGRKWKHSYDHKPCL